MDAKNEDSQRPLVKGMCSPVCLTCWAPSNVRRVISKGPTMRRYIALWSGRRALEAAITSYTSPRVVVQHPALWRCVRRVALRRGPRAAIPPAAIPALEDDDAGVAGEGTGAAGEGTGAAGEGAVRHAAPRARFNTTAGAADVASLPGVAALRGFLTGAECF